MFGTRFGFGTFAATRTLAAICTIAATCMFAPTAVRAADMPVYLPVIEEFSGWYLRGDIGFSNQSVGSLGDANYANYISVQTVNKSFDSAPFGGIGIGYSFNNWLRFDVTGEYRGSANFHGFEIGTDGGGPHDDNYSGSKSEWTFLLNGYVDLGTWYNLTPFIGAGIGTSRNTISNFTDIGESTGNDSYAGTASKWNFAWALYAGVGYNLTKNVTLEFAYRYIDLGNATTGDQIGYDGTNNLYNPKEFNHLTSNDFKLGLRFNLDGLFEQPHPVYYAPPPPLRSKG
jgi:opacity protein-like surface antigen